MTGRGGPDSAVWARLVSTVLGVWLMAAPAVLDYGDPARTADRIAGPLVAAFAFVAVWEVLRELRWVVAVLAVWLLAAPWVLGYAMVPTLNEVVVGVLLLALSFVRGPRRERFGGGWAALARGRAPRPRAAR
jgi:hypothetical protein